MKCIEQMAEEATFEGWIELGKKSPYIEIVRLNRDLREGEISSRRITRDFGETSFLKNEKSRRTWGMSPEKDRAAFGVDFEIRRKVHHWEMKWCGLNDGVQAREHPGQSPKDVSLNWGTKKGDYIFILSDCDREDYTNYFLCGFP